MGNYVTKYFYHDNDIQKVETDIQSPINKITAEENIMHTPTVQKSLPIDPRSVTTGIDRTPIEVNCTPVGLNKRMISAIPKHLQMKPYLETDIDKVISCLSPKKSTPELTEIVKLEFSDVQNKSVDDNDVNNEKRISSIEKERYKILGLDPRSPAADFDRTPILHPKSMQRLRARYFESLHRRGSYETDVCTTISYCEMSSPFNVPEIQVLPDLAMCLTKSLNLVNTNCDDSLNKSDSSCSNHSSRTGIISTNDEEIIVTDDDKASLETSNFNNMYIKKDKHDVTRVNDDTIKVWRDSLVSNSSEEEKLIESGEVKIVEEDVSQLPKEEVIITFDDDSIAKDTLSMKLFKSQNDKQKPELSGKKKKLLKSDVKSVTDEKKVFHSNDKNCGNESTKIRTPLGNRSNNGQIQTILTKSPQQIFKNKNIVPKQLQENTPSHKKYMVKSKLGSIQWDPDSTVII